MKTKMQALALLAAVAFACASAHAADEPGPSGATSAELVAFTHKLQAAVAAKQPAAVAELISFPLRVNQHQQKPKYLTRAQLVASFNSVFTPHVAAVIAAQDPQSIFQNSNGAMFGNGEVWLGSVCDSSSCTSSKLLVVAINLSPK